MDFITGLPHSNGWDVIMVVVDRFTKATHFFGLAHPYTACSVVATFVRQVVHLHGVPSLIILDRDPILVSSFWSELFKAIGIKLRMSSVYHPETDGQSKVMNRYINILTVFCLGESEAVGVVVGLGGVLLQYQFSFGDRVHAV